MFRLSCAQIQFLAVDNTHTKYLHGADKKTWTNYASALKAQTQLENFMDSFGNIPHLAAGEEYEIPVNKNIKKNQKQSNK